MVSEKFSGNMPGIDRYYDPHEDLEAELSKCADMPGVITTGSVC